MGSDNGTSRAVEAEAARRRRYRDLDGDETPLENTRETDHYKAQYVMGFVDKWDELINWDARAESEGDFFIEQSMTIRFSSKESDLVNFLWKLGSSDTMVRVSQMRVNPDKNRYRLSGSTTLTASYQKDVKATKPKPATEAKAKPVAAKPAAKPEPAKPKAETKPAKPSGTKRTIPTRRARKTQ